MSEVFPELTNLSIPDLDKENIKVLGNLLQESANELNHEIKIEIVGGAVKKQWPRKDIDVSLTISDLKGKLKGTAIERAEKTFSVMEEIVHNAVRKGAFRIAETTRPYLDHEFESPAIVAHDGSIVVMPLSGTLIEIINNG